VQFRWRSNCHGLGEIIDVVRVPYHGATHSSIALILQLWSKHHLTLFLLTGSFFAVTSRTGFLIRACIVADLRQCAECGKTHKVDGMLIREDLPPTAVAFANPMLGVIVCEEYGGAFESQSNVQMRKTSPGDSPT